MTVKLDSVETLTAEFEYGVCTYLERLAKVTGLKASTDYNALMTALASVGIPANWSSPATLPQLRLTKKKVTMVDKDMAEIHMTYTHFIKDIQYADGGTEESPVTLYGEVAATIQQVPSNKDENGDMIVLQHTYPSDDEDLAGKTKEQTGEISVFEVQKTRTYKFFYTVEDPDALADLALGTINDDVWNGGAAKTWLCTAFNFVPHVVNGASSQWLFTVEFQYSPGTWDPTAVFVDERWGRPPADLVAGVGYKVIERLALADFDALVPNVEFR